MTDVYFVDVLSTSPPNGTIELNAIINARRLYQSCVVEDTIGTDPVDTILSIIDGELGGWPVLQGASWNNSTFNLTQLMVKLNSYNSYIIFKISSEPDDNNASITGLRVRRSIDELR